MSSVFITGVSSGLGWGLAKKHLSLGHTVYGISRRTPENLESPNFHFLPLDLADLDQIPEALPPFLPDSTPLDLVYLNAAILGEIRDMKETPLPDIRHSMNVNVWANKILIDILTSLPISIKQIIAISSGASINGHHGWNAYSLSKATLNMLIQLYAGELPHTHLTALAPGLIDTSMQDYLCGKVNPEKFSSVTRLIEQRNTSAMPHPEEAASRIISALDKIRSHPSGSYLDIRNL